MGLLGARYEPASVFLEPARCSRLRPCPRDKNGAAMIEGKPLRAAHVASIRDIAQPAWDGLFPTRAEGWSYFRACEAAMPRDFAASAIGVWAGDDLVAAAPLFRTDYRLDLSLEGWLKPVVGWLRRNAPSLVVVPVVGMGSPLTEECPLGLRPGLKPQEKLAALETLIAGVEAHAAANGVPLVALKDVRDRDASFARELLARRGFTGVATLPVATLHLPFADEDAYLASLSASMRSDLRKKLRQSAQVEIEVRDAIDGVEDDIVKLFAETKAHRKADYGAFDDVPPSYFAEVMASLPGRAQIMLTRVDGRVASFNLFLIERERIIGKYVGMHYELARDHNLYFVNWMATACLCMERGIPWLQTGQTSYRQKVRLGSKLKRSSVFFRYANPVINPLFKLFGPMMAFDRMDPDLRELGTDAPYLGANAAP